MSETSKNGFHVPPEQDFDTVGFQGSMQQVLQENIGNYVIVDFLIGTGTLESRQGILYNVASQFIVLYDDLNLRYVVCDIFSIKFVTFLLPGYRPGQIPSVLPSSDAEGSEAEAAETAAMSEASRQSAANTPAAETLARPPITPSQAAYAHAVRRTATSPSNERSRR